MVNRATTDESRCRPGTTTCNGERTGDDSDEAIRQGQRTLQSVHSDDTDESSSRETRSSHTDKSIDTGQKSIHLAANLMEYFEGHQTSSTGMVGDESINRGIRCSMSKLQWDEQLATPVPQDGSIDTTVVNKQDVDERWVTNKHTNVKQDSILVPNKWLSGTFSKIAFSVWGKSKTGEEIMENVHDKLSIMPEFNFSL